MKKLAFLFLMLLGTGGSLFAQNSPFSFQVLSGSGRPIAGASITVCLVGAAGVPCSPTSSIYATASSVIPLTQPILTDAFGNFSAFAPPGNYEYTISGTAIGPTTAIPFTVSCQPGISCVSANANNAFTGANTMGKLNAIRYVDGVQFTTIDLAVADCAGVPCTVIIPSTYAGAESSHLVTSTLGYTFYKPVANESVFDNRYATGTSRPNYSYSFNGQNLGQLSRYGVTQSCASAVDSCVGATITNFISGTMPANNGTQTGAVSIAAVTGTITRGASLARVVAHEGYVSLDATVADTPFADVRGFSSSINIDRSTSVQGTVTAAGYTAAAHTNISTSGATIQFAYGFDGQLQTVGTSRNYSYHSVGNFLFENQASIWAVDSGGTQRQMYLFRSDNGIDFQPLADASGWNWKTQGGAGLFGVNSNNIVSRVQHQFNAGTLIGGGISTTAPSSGNTGFQHKRFAGNLGGTCPTAAAIGAPCTSGNINWVAAFADNNYTVTCSLVGAMTAQPHIVSVSYQAAGVGITITIAADTAAAANVAPTGFTDCVAVHD